MVNMVQLIEGLLYMVFTQQKDFFKEMLIHLQVLGCIVLLLSYTSMIINLFSALSTQGQGVPRTGTSYNLCVDHVFPSFIALF